MAREWTAAHILELLPQLPPQLSSDWIHSLEAELKDIDEEEEAAAAPTMSPTWSPSMESSSLHSKKRLLLERTDLGEMVTEMWKKKAELRELAGGLRGDGGVPILIASEDDGRHLCLCLLLALLPSLPNLYQLEMSYIPMMSTSTEAREQAVEVLCEALLSQHWSTTLRQLILSHNLGTEKGCQHLAQLLSSTYCKLQYLELSSTGMGADGMRHIAHALETENTSLTTLYILDCPAVGDAGVQFLAAVLRNNISSTLQDLYLRNVGMTADGLRHLCDALSSDQATSPSGMPAGTNLKLLDVSSNHGIGRRGAVHLANMLHHNRSLHKLDVSWLRSFSAADWSGLILSALARNTRLQCIAMRHCDGVRGDQVQAALYNVLRINTTIQEIDLYGTPLHEAGKAEAVEEELRLNKQFRNTLSEMPTSKPSSCRIILCGREYAGKTTLLEGLKRLQHLTLYQRIKVGGHSFRRFLFGQSANSQELHKRTRGIDIHLLKDEQDLRISVWDLAGQREFHALHHLMFPGSGNSAATMFVFTFSPIRSPTEDGAGQVKEHKQLKDDLYYWLQFIASKQSPGNKPSMVVVITNSDRLAAKLGRVAINLWLSGALAAISMLATEFHDLVGVRPEPFLVDALDPHDLQLKSWMEHMEDSLRATLSVLPPVPTICDLVAKAATSARTSSPIISASEFVYICKLEAQDRVVSELLDSGEQHWRAIAAYMHNAGELIYHEKLEFIVRNPRWFGQGILGNLIDLFSNQGSPRSASLFHNILNCCRQQMDVSLPRDYLPRNGYMSKNALGDLLLVAQQRVPGLRPQDLKPDQLIKLMLLLNLCYERKPGDPDTGYLLPALFDDQGSKAATGMRPLKWRNYLPQNISTIAGRRLECADPHRTFLTDGFFPHLQVVLHNNAFANKWVEAGDSDNCRLEKNLFNILVNGMDIMVEYSGFTGYFVDILVMSSKPYAETMDFVQLNFTSTIRTFCASQEGCQGETLREAIIRPACLRRATPLLCAYRKKNQVIAIEDLEQKVASTDNYMHSWVEVKDERGHVVLHAGEDSPKILLNGQGPFAPKPTTSTAAGPSQRPQASGTAARLDSFLGSQAASTALKFPTPVCTETNNKYGGRTVTTTTSEWDGSKMRPVRIQVEKMDKNGVVREQEETEIGDPLPDTNYSEVLVRQSFNKVEEVEDKVEDDSTQVEDDSTQVETCYTNTKTDLKSTSEVLFESRIEGTQLEGQFDLGEIKTRMEGTHLEGQVDLGEIKTRMEGTHLEGQVDLGEMKTRMEGTHLEGQVDLGEIKTRQDVSALGFANVEVPFQSGQVLCLFKFEALPVGDIVHIYFLHEEGMACLVGVGLTNSVVILRADSDDIYVRELGEVDWKRMWTTEEYNCTSAPILFTKRERNSLGDGGLASTHPAGNDEKEVSTEEARNPYSYEDGPQATFTLKGASLSMLKGRSLLHGLTRRVVQSSVEAANQGSSRHLGETGCREPAGQDSEVDNTVSTQSSMTTGEGSGLAQLQPQPSTTSNRSDVKMTEGSNGKPESAQVTTDGRQGEEGTDKVLTVKVILDRRHSRSYQKDASTDRMVDVGSLDGVKDLGLTMTVKFFPQELLNKLEVSLEADYYLDSIQPKDKNSTGWCQDNLISSFECLDESDLLFLARGVLTPLAFYISKFKTIMQTPGEDKKAGSSSAGVSFSAFLSVVKAALTYLSSRIKTDTTSKAQETESPFELKVLDQSMFQISDVHNGKDVKYHATVVEPSLKTMMLWDQRCRTQAQYGKLLSTFGYSVWGSWELYKDPKQPRYDYEVSVSRTLQLTTLLDPQEQKTKGKETTSESEMTTKEALQKLTKRFQISHVFDHTNYADYYRSLPYVWDMESERPCPVPDILKESEILVNDRGTVEVERLRNNVSRHSLSALPHGPEPNHERAPAEESCYPNTWKRGRRKGLALIVSMESERPGAAVDRGRLETLAKVCGFTERVLVDPVVRDITGIINSLVAEVLEEDECFLGSINGHGGTHGGQPYTLDKDRAMIMVMSEIVEPFRRSKHLQGKPKVIFINCCRGRKLYDNSQSVDGNCQSVEADADAQQGTGSSRPHVTNLSDCLLVFSTSEDCPSCRDPLSGSIFVKHLVDTVVANRQKMDVLRMMTLVNFNVTEEQNLVKDPGGKTEVLVGQCCEYRATLRKNLYWKEP